MALKWPDKDPDEVLDYSIDWTARIPATDSIITSTWTVPTGITKDSDSHTTVKSVIWLSAGVEGNSYDLTNRVVTNEGRTMDQTVRIKIKSK